jgi:methylated-DNA-[protein]-cysteine S-methyltransferase
MLESAVVECAGDVRVRLTASAAGLRSIEFRLDDPAQREPASSNPHIVAAARQLCAYFAGDLRRFDLTLDPRGTEFQQRVWRELETIPFGEIRSYAQVAAAIGAPRAVRAVGAANGANPLPIVVPCHRVIGSGGKLVGYGGGLALKQRLLALEGCNMLLFRS